MKKCIFIWWVTVDAVVVIIVHYCIYSPDTINYYRVHTSCEAPLVKLRKLDVLQETSFGVHNLSLIIFSFDNISILATATEQAGDRSEQHWLWRKDLYIMMCCQYLRQQSFGL